MQETIVLYPAPGMGHVISMVELGKLIIHHYKQRFSITILLINVRLWDSPAITSYINAISQSHPLISFRRFPLSSVDTTPTRSRAAMAFEGIRLNAPNALRSLKEISTTSKIVAFVLDLFCGSALSIGKDLGIPTYYFFTSGAACLGAFLYFPKIHQQHTTSFKDLTDAVFHFPTLPPLKAVHMPEPTLERQDPAYDDMVYFCSHLSKADGIIVNTFEELEPRAVKTIAEGLCVPDAVTPPTYCVGPLIAEGPQQHDCLLWLDKQPRKSVVFLCFGSRGSFSLDQIKELAIGLERSEQRFLWVVKKPPEDESKKQTEDVSDDFDLNESLPEGFLERVKNRAMIVKSWAPQVAVLSHDSVGGFVTHCGWNSILEAVVAGVPMVAWPLYAEQHLNRDVLVEEMKMAIPVEQRQVDGFVGADELERRVKELMESEKGSELREKSWRMKEKALAATAPSGTSILNLAKWVEAWDKKAII